MEKVVVFKTNENEILEMINKHFCTEMDSIVADQELGNQVWVVHIDKTLNDEQDEEEIAKFIAGQYIPYMVPRLLNRMCKDGILEEGEYTIDCTW